MSGVFDLTYAPTDMDELITATQAAHYTGRTVVAICKWAERGLIKPEGLSPQGKPMYRFRAIAQTELRTRARSEARYPRSA